MLSDAVGSARQWQVLILITTDGFIDGHLQANQVRIGANTRPRRTPAGHGRSA